MDAKIQFFIIFAACNHSKLKMKIFQSSIFRAVCAIVVGALLIKYPDEGVTWLTVAIGILFLLSGIIALMAYMNAKKHASEYTITDQEGRIISGSQPTFPIVGTGSIILGLTLALTPGVFIHGLMYILGAIMILGGLNQLMALISARRLGPISFSFWIAPSLVLITGLFVVFRPMDSAEIPLLILGWCSLLYGVTEIINSLKIHSIRKQADHLRDELARQRSAEEAQNAEEISSHVGDDSLDKGFEDMNSGSILVPPRDD
jgi:uncharacterized membrane protein HdeD (DUF308 family)